ncbi:DivIVA domain-containing protein [Salinispora arenicola]|uniref:DivIVA domain-containing protein n=1 Tax=Salinispora arenicola TaxID=168697 RepID=UPI00036AB178
MPGSGRYATRGRAGHPRPPRCRTRPNPYRKDVTAMIHRARRLFSSQVRAATFARRRWRGLDPDQVYAYLDRVADELERLAREATTAHAEGELIRQALRQWQSRHADCQHAAATSNSWWHR